MDIQHIIHNSFPKSLKNEIDEILLKVPFENVDGNIQEFKLVVANDVIYLQQRLFYNEIPIEKFDFLSATQKEILYCILTINYDGHTREKYLKKIILSKNKWVVPYVIKLLGEYVIEILEIIESNLEFLEINNYIEFIKNNRSFYEIKRQQMISYWDCYYKTKKDSNLNVYVGAKIFKYFDDQINTF